jgi:kinesin family member 5
MTSSLAHSGSMKNKSTRENVRVVCRVRPQNAREIKEGGVPCVKVTKTSIEVHSGDEGSHTFQFDRVFGFESDQKSVFDDAAVPLIHDVLNGYNATIFAYGQTGRIYTLSYSYTNFFITDTGILGTGKTHTMEGNIHDSNLKGIIPRSVEALFDGVEEADENIEFTFKISFVEIYMEKIRDLLDETRLKVNLIVREDRIKGLYIAGVTEEYVTSDEELLDIMAMGAGNRATAATGMNEGSSRSHSVFTITVGQRDIHTNATKSGKLILIDLAGSETVKKSGASGQQLEEAKTINKSLSALGGVINALTDDKQSHIPYRDSKLTRLLQDSLGGNSKTVLIIAVSPSSFNAVETIATCRFGTRAKSIQNKVSVNQTRTAVELEVLLARAEKTIETQAGQMSTLQEQVSLLQTAVTNGADPALAAELAKMFAKSKNGASHEHDDEYRDESKEALLDQIASLQTDLEEERHESNRKDTEIAQLNQMFKEKETLLVEAGDLLLEAQHHYETQRERSDQLSREKTDLLGQLESVKARLQDELEKARFDVRELQVNVDTLRAENLQLRKELSEMSGDAMETGPLSSPRDNGMPSQSGKSDASSMNQSLRGSLATGYMNSDHVAGITHSNDYAEGISQAISRTSIESGIDLPKFKEQFKTLCEDFMINEDAALSIWNIIQVIVIQFESVLSSYRSQNDVIAKIRADYSKRFKEMDIQRTRLEKDLQMRTEKVFQQQLQIDDIRQMNQQALGEYFSERDKGQLKSLQQRLEQLVAVHRQLLRKFATLELESVEAKKRIQLRDERIRQLETNARTVSGNMRQQAERHVAELSNLREQIQVSILTRFLVTCMMMIDRWTCCCRFCAPNNRRD